MAYATVAVLIQQFDARVIGDLVADTGTRVTGASLLTDDNAEYALSRASGLINAAVQFGQRYTPAELAALTGDDQALLQGLTADLAFVFLCQRRGVVSPLYEECAKRSEEILKQMRDGEMVFNVGLDVGAGTPNTTFPSSVQYQTLGLLRDRAKLFPIRREMYPVTGGNSSS